MPIPAREQKATQTRPGDAAQRGKRANKTDSAPSLGRSDDRSGSRKPHSRHHRGTTPLDRASEQQHSKGRREPTEETAQAKAEHGRHKQWHGTPAADERSGR